MKNSPTLARACALIAVWCLSATSALAGSNSTDPSSHLTIISDGAGHTITFAPKLTVEWTGSGNSKKVKSTSFKIENQDSNRDFYVATVYILGTANKILWSSSPNKQVVHKKSASWNSGDISGSLGGLLMSGMKVEYELTFGSATSYLLWDPNTGGAASTSKSTTKTGTS